MRHVVAVSLLVLLLSACDFGARRQISHLREENESLESRLQLSSLYIQDVTAIIDEVQKNLNAIEEREDIIGRISLSPKGSESDARRRAVNVRREVLAKISDIDAFILDNREKMNLLKERIEKSAVRIESLERLVDNLTVTVQEKEKSVKQLKERVQSLEQNVASLQGKLRENEAALQSRDSTIAEQQDSLREKDETIQTKLIEEATAYYVVDTRDALRKNGLITERRSGFLGLGKTTSVGSILTDYFTGIPKQQTTISFDPSVKDVKIVSAHRDRPDLFHFVRSQKGSQLVITDPEGFWALSKYLVIISND